ncbi:MAG: 50S ribosomal protein L10 [Polyangiales bacterium]
MTMNKADKTTQVEAVREYFEKATSTVLVDFRGVNVELITALRAKFREAGVEYKVIKNNLVKKALENTPLADNDQFKAYLAGPTAIAWSFDDPSAAAKVIKNFRKDNADVLTPKDKEEKLLVKCGLLDGNVLNAKRVENELATLPGKRRNPCIASRATHGADAKPRRSTQCTRAEHGVGVGRLHTEKFLGLKDAKGQSNGNDERRTNGRRAQQLVRHGRGGLG